MVIINCDIFADKIKQSGIEHYSLWKKVSFWSIRYGKIFRALRLFNFSNINPKLLDLNSDCIIVFDSGIEENSVLKWLANRYKNSRLIFYYWNPVFTSIHPSKIPPEFEKWSYSPTDCEKYGMMYNSQFYFKSFVKPSVPIQRDVFFIGKNKGREAGLNKIKKMFDQSNLTSLFYITATHARLNQKKYRKKIPYEKALEYVNESKALLDYYVDPYAGLSLRAMESVFLGKKLITNNKTIVKYDFFCEQNVFLIESEEGLGLKNFFEKPYKHIDAQVKENYSFDKWMGRF